MAAKRTTEESSSEDQAPNALGRAFRALRNPAYRWYFVSGMGMSAAQGFQQLALAWLVLDLTGSLAQLGLVVFARGLPMAFLGVFGGVIGDRYNRRLLLMANQLVAMLSMFLLAVLVLADRVEVWHVLVAALVQGGSASLTGPARQAMIRGLVSNEDLINAVTLNSIQLQASRILWPTLSGGLIAAVGSGGVLVACAGGYLVGFVFLIPVPDVSGQRRAGRTNSPVADLLDGVRFTFTSPMLGMVLVLASAMATFGLTFRELAPGFGRQVMSFNEFETGLFLMAAGAGALVGSIVLLFFEVKRLALLLVCLCVGLGLSMLVIAVNPTYGVAFLVMGIFGLCNTTALVVAQTVFQLTVPQEFLGRVSSIYMLAPGLSALLTLPTGIVGDAIGLRWAIGAIALVLLAVSIVLGVAPLSKLEKRMAEQAEEESRREQAQSVSG